MNFTPDQPEEEYDIVRKKTFPMKPMTQDGSDPQMNLLEHSFSAFRDEDNNSAFAVVYRRVVAATESLRTQIDESNGLLPMGRRPFYIQQKIWQNFKFALDKCRNCDIIQNVPWLASQPE